MKSQLLTCLTCFCLTSAACGSDELQHISIDQCEGLGGQVVGDEGTGSTRRPEYRCADGERPVASVDFGIEGGVCCP